MMVATEFIEQGYPAVRVLKILSLSRSGFYYKPNGRKQGKRTRDFVLNKAGDIFKIEEVLEDIKHLLAGEFVDYGYYKTYIYLSQILGYKIGSSSVYKLMKAHNLLKFQRGGKKKYMKNWVKDLVPNPTNEFSFLEFDIKYVYVAGKRTNAQILTVLDVYSRWSLGQYINWRIDAQNVIDLFKKIISEYPMPKKFIVRNDNGSQFEADITQNYLRQLGITQEFTKPATPQQNAHIESYHSIVESAVCCRMEFDDLNDLREKMDRFRIFYNFERIHGGLKYKSPYQYLLQKGTNMKDCSPCEVLLSKTKIIN